MYENPLLKVDNVLVGYKTKFCQGGINFFDEEFTFILDPYLFYIFEAPIFGFMALKDGWGW